MKNKIKQIRKNNIKHIIIDKENILKINQRIKDKLNVKFKK
jgi:hypothetical protein